MVFLSSTIVAVSFVLDVALKTNVETIYLFKLIFKFVHESFKSALNHLLTKNIKDFTN